MHLSLAHARFARVHRERREVLSCSRRISETAEIRRDRLPSIEIISPMLGNKSQLIAPRTLRSLTILLKKGEWAREMVIRAYHAAFHIWTNIFHPLLSVFIRDKEPFS